MGNLKTFVATHVCLFLLAATPISASDIDISSYKEKFENLSSTFETPHDLSINEQFGLKKAGWRKSTRWSKSLSKKSKHGDGVTVAIFDSKVDCGHPNLKITKKRCSKEGPNFLNLAF